MFGADRFWSAFARAGMLSTAKYRPVEGGELVTVEVGFSRPDGLMMSEMVQVMQPTMEFPASQMPGVKDGIEVEVDGVMYTVRGQPMSKGDGTFKVAELVKKR